MDERTGKSTVTSTDETSDVTAELDRLRAENERLRAEVDSAGPGSVQRARRRRRWIAMVMVVLGAVLLFTSVLTVWTRNLVMDTDRYVETVAPLAADPAVKGAISARISEKVSEEADVQSLAEEVLPDNASFLAGPIASGADNLIARAADRIVESDQFEDAWIEANRIGHRGLVSALTGREDKALTTNDGKVVLQLGVLAESVVKAVDRQFGLDLADKVPTERLDVSFVLVDSQQLSDVQTGFRWLDRLSWFGVILSLGLLIGSIFVAPDRRRGLLHVGVGTALSMFALFLAASIGRDVYLNNLPEGVQSVQAAATIFDTVTRFVLQAVRTLFVVGVVLALAAWLAGPSNAARRVRGYWNRLVGGGSSLAGSAVSLGPVPAWCADHLLGLRVAVAAIAAFVLIVWNRPTGKAVILVAVGAVVALALIQLVAGIARGPDADHEPADLETADVDTADLETASSDPG